MKFEHIALITLLILPQTAFGNSSDAGTGSHTLISFDIHDRDGHDDDRDGAQGGADPHNCSPAGSIRGPYKPSQADSSGTEGSFEARAKVACELKQLPKQVECSPKFPRGDSPKYTIHCNGRNEAASGAMSIQLDDAFCRCQNKKTSENSLGGATDSLRGEEALDEILELFPELVDSL